MANIKTEKTIYENTVELNNLCKLVFTFSNGKTMETTDTNEKINLILFSLERKSQWLFLDDTLVNIDQIVHVRKFIVNSTRI